jgi:hypothetical protein
MACNAAASRDTSPSGPGVNQSSNCARGLAATAAYMQVGWTGTAADKVGAGRIMTVKLSSGKLQPLTQPNDRFPAFVSGGIFPTLRGDVTPAWSPDGSRVAFASQVEPSGAFEVVSVRAPDGRDRRRVTTSSGGSEQHVTVAWQPVVA